MSQYQIVKIPPLFEGWTLDDLPLEFTFYASPVIVKRGKKVIGKTIPIPITIFGIKKINNVTWEIVGTMSRHGKTISVDVELFRKSGLITVVK